jgi:penicillin-binding protein 2
MSTGAIYNGMGQGDVLVTPIQLANYVAAIANVVGIILLIS